MVCAGGGYGITTLCDQDTIPSVRLCKHGVGVLHQIGAGYGWVWTRNDFATLAGDA